MARDPLTYYNTIASRYNTHVFSSPYERYRFDTITTTILSFLPEKKNLYIHDTGAGTGEFTIPFLEHALADAKIHASDFSSEMVGVCKKRFPKHEHSIQNAEAMTFHDSLFDVVISRQMLEHVPHPQQALREMHRILKPGGALVLSTPSWFGFIAPFYYIKKATGTMQPIDNWWTPIKLRRYIQNAGFSHIIFTSVCFIPYHTVLPQFLVPLIKKIDRFLSRIPLMRYFGRTLIFRAEKVN